LAEVVDRRGLERAIEQAEVLRLFDLRAVEDVLARANGRRGAAVLRAVLADLAEPALTKSDLEERFLAPCRRGKAPRPGLPGRPLASRGACDEAATTDDGRRVARPTRRLGRLAATAPGKSRRDGLEGKETANGEQTRMQDGRVPGH
jgi:hypothetical protein